MLPLPSPRRATKLHVKVLEEKERRNERKREKEIEKRVARGSSREETIIRRLPGHASYVFLVAAESIAIDASDRSIEANRVAIRRSKR